MTDDSLKIGESEGDKKLVDEMKQNLRSVASSIDDNLIWCDDGSAWNKVSEKYKAALNKKEVHAVYETMLPYMVGRELPDEDERSEIVKDARRVLSLRTPDLNMRLPWYDAMFDIMDKGRHTGISGGVFSLEPAVRQELVDRLAERTCFEKNALNRMVKYLAFEMGAFPGAQYNAHKSGRRHSLSRLQEIDLICTYLHAPVAVAYQKEIASDFFMGEIYRRLGR